MPNDCAARLRSVTRDRENSYIGIIEQVHLPECIYNIRIVFVIVVFVSETKIDQLRSITGKREKSFLSVNQKKNLVCSFLSNYRIS